MNWFRYDICFCGNGNDCPKKEECLRTMSNEEKNEVVDLKIRYSVASFYNENEDCKNFLQIQ